MKLWGLLAVAALAALAGCGSGGSESGPEVAIEWSQPNYVGQVGVPIAGASVRLSGKDVPPIMAVDLRSSPPGLDFGAAPFWMNSQGQVPVRLAGALGGAYMVTATATINGVAYTATSQVLVR